MDLDFACGVSEVIDKEFYNKGSLKGEHEVEFKDVLNEIEDIVIEYEGVSRGKKFKFPRLSVLISGCEESAVIEGRKCVKREVLYEGDIKRENIPDAKSLLFTYNSLPVISWNDAPVICGIREYIEKKEGVEIATCLVNLYLDGTQYIGWHSDREGRRDTRTGSKGKPVYSVSFGASRKFRFRKVGEKKGRCEELILKDGDYLVMKVGCQDEFEHSVPVEKRINLTFRVK